MDMGALRYIAHYSLKHYDMFLEGDMLYIIDKRLKRLHTYGDYFSCQLVKTEEGWSGKYLDQPDDEWSLLHDHLQPHIERILGK